MLGDYGYTPVWQTRRDKEDGEFRNLQISTEFFEVPVKEDIVLCLGVTAVLQHPESP